MQFSEADIQFTPREVEFLAEDTVISIVPNFSLRDSTITCVGGDYGPFRPNFPVEVPLWLALFLHRRRKCRILPPPWLQPDSLQEVLDNERDTEDAFQPLPFHYIEEAHMLFTYAKDTFGEDLYKVKSFTEEIRKVRFAKIEHGLAVLQGPLTVKLNHLSASECNIVRHFFQGSLDEFLDLAQMHQPQETGL